MDSDSVVRSEPATYGELPEASLKDGEGLLKELQYLDKSPRPPWRTGWAVFVRVVRDSSKIAPSDVLVEGIDASEIHSAQVRSVCELG